MGELKIAVNSNTQEIKLEGVIDENYNFENVLGSIEGQVLVINCRDVKKINSTGVKTWINFFQEFNKKNQVKFTELSIVLVEQLNSVMNFACGATIESIMVPFICTDCNKESNHLMDTSFLRGMSSIADAECPFCKGHAEFDDLPEEYFSFLEYYK